MTLHEYLNQENPSALPNVLLEQHEVVLYKVHGGEYQCQIPAVALEFKIDAIYNVNLDNLRLYTLQFNRPSCFSLNFDPSELKSESTFQPLK